MRKPDLARMIEEVINLDVINPTHWAHTFEASGVTVEMVKEAVAAERKLRADEA